MGDEQDDNITELGERWVWGQMQRFGIRRADRRQHLYALGQTGTGKSTLLLNMIASDIRAGEGVGLIDPHGDLAEAVLDQIPSWRTEDVVYFNPSDFDWPVGLNLLGAVSAERRHLAASGAISAFKSIWGESWGPRLEYIFYAALAALLECQNVSLLGVPRLLTDKRYRAWVIRQVKDPVVRAFWLVEFESYNRQFISEAISPVLNKVGQLLMSPPVRNILGQVRSRFDPRFMMDRRRIFIANLAKGRLGEAKANLLGALLVAKFQLAAMERADVSEKSRPDFFLFVDEFHNYSTDSFASILSEARKYRLCLTLSHQYIDQLRAEIRDAVFGNVGTMVAFRVGEHDADVLEKAFGGGYSPSRFAELSNHEVWVKLLKHGEYGDSFLGKTLPPAETRHGRRQTIIRRSREKYGAQQRVVEDKIERWMNVYDRAKRSGKESWANPK